MQEPCGYLIKIFGTVQGVGFRPYVFNLAHQYNLTGSVYNDGQGVVLKVEGEPAALHQFYQQLKTSPPPLAHIERIDCREQPRRGYREFIIRESQRKGGGQAPLPPDIATCAACLQELHDPLDRHYQYPFTNCTNCGPRFTILQELPYDRQRTTMQEFPMCSFCNQEYQDPRDRRFHAQPVACPRCGPRVELLDAQGRPVLGDWLVEAARLLKQGHILAIKGLGGFHLACDAYQSGAVAELRRRKGRPTKPLAVMARHIQVIEQFCCVSSEEASLLQSPAAPIVLLQQKEATQLPRELAPGMSCLGCMLPYTPLHQLLLQQGPELLVMTSGNRSGLPLVKDNDRALKQLGKIADYFLCHNRDILNRCDDSVTQVVAGQIQILRRSRGYVPQPLVVPVNPKHPTVLAVGGELKNTFCLLHEGKAYLSQHMGETTLLEGQQNLQDSIRNFCRLLGIKPAVVTSDLHPHYTTIKLADQLAEQWGARRHSGVQHHHGHLASCLAENQVLGQAIGVILDGTGYGLDGNLWGFEIGTGDYEQFNREYFLDFVPLPGGEQAIRQPWICAAAYLLTFLEERGRAALERLYPDKGLELAILERVLATATSPLASSCGRLFDAVAAITGLCSTSTYEGEGAILLGNQAPWLPTLTLQPYPFAIRGQLIDPAPVLAHILQERESHTPTPVIAKRFHDTLISIILEAACRIRQKTGLHRVALSGGTWQNRYLSAMAKQVLQTEGFQVLQHQQVPANDGGLALGQAVIASSG